MDNLKGSKLNICVITHPFSDNIAAETLLANFIKIIEPLSNEIFVITGKFPESSNKKPHIIIKLKGVNEKDSFLKRFLKFILTQLEISYNMAKISKNIDIVIFYIGARLYILSMLFVKLLRKKVVVVATGSSSKIAERNNGRLFGIFPPIFGILEGINYYLSNQIVVYSEGLIEEYNLETYKNKITIAHEHFLDFNKFKIIKKFDERNNLVGYIGRLSEEKGTLNFVKAIPKVLEKENKIKFLVGGDGQLRDKIEEYLDVASLNDKVKLTGWIPDEEFLTYLNELKLFVLPSYTEGLPYTILEAMACGTPVLATPVGSIPDVIKDGETGFIMENNSPECIAENIVRALAHPNINEITKNARALMEENYNYQAAVEKYRIILSTF